VVYIKTALTLPFSQIQITVLFKSPAISPHKCFSLIACFVYGSTHCLARRAQMSSAPSPDWECLLKIDALDTHNKERLSADRLASLNCTSTNAFSALRPFRESNNLWGCKYAFWCWTYWKDQMIIACTVGLNERRALSGEKRSDFNTRCFLLKNLALLITSRRCFSCWDQHEMSVADFAGSQHGKKWECWGTS